MNQRLIILACTHKKFDIFKDEHIVPIHVGRSKTDLNLGFIGDDTGENISDKNDNYCELTAQYWAWKNLTDYDYLGVCHYRRFFNFSRTYKEELVTADKFIDIKHHLRYCDDLLNYFEIILPKPVILKNSLKDHYLEFHIESHYILLREVLLNLFPAYVESFDKVFEGNIFYSYNMFVTRQSIFQGYSEWLFCLLFELEKRIEIPDDKYQKRVFGFLGERLLYVYVFHNKLKVTELPIIYVKQDIVFDSNNINLQLSEILGFKKIISLIFFKIKLKILKLNR
jgi:hypothetical protein